MVMGERSSALPETRPPKQSPLPGKIPEASFLGAPQKPTQKPLPLRNCGNWCFFSNFSEVPLKGKVFSKIQVKGFPPLFYQQMMIVGFMASWVCSYEFYLILI